MFISTRFSALLAASAITWLATSGAPIQAPERFLQLEAFPGVDPTCASDSTVGIQAAFAKIGRNGQPTEIHVGPGHFCFSSLYTGTAQFILAGSGTSTVFVQTSPDADGLVIGYPGGINNAGAVITDGVTIRDLVFDTKAGVTKKGGNMILAYYTRNMVLRDIHIGSPELDIQNPHYHSFRGITLAGFYQDLLDNVEIHGAADDGLTVYGLPDTPEKASQANYASEIHITGQSQFNIFGRCGIHIAGGVGGFNLESGNVSLAASWGVCVDRTLAPDTAANPQLFFGPQADLDSNKAGGIIIQDYAYGHIEFKGWIATNGGAGMRITARQNPNCSILVSGANVYNNGADGIDNAGAEMTIAGGTQLVMNGAKKPGGSGLHTSANAQTFASDFSATGNGKGGIGYGVNDEATAGSTVLGPALYRSNKTASFRSVRGLGFLTIASPHL